MDHSQEHLQLLLDRLDAVSRGDPDPAPEQPLTEQQRRLLDRVSGTRSAFVALFDQVCGPTVRTLTVALDGLTKLIETLAQRLSVVDPKFVDELRRQRS